MRRRLPVRLAAAALALVTAAVVAVTAAPAGAGVTPLTPDEMVAIFDDADLDGLAEPAEVAITGDVDADQRIRQLAESADYELRATPDRALTSFDGALLQSPVAAAWEDLRSAGAATGHPLTIVSSYRSVDQQRNAFLDRIDPDYSPDDIADGDADEHILEILESLAPPGYSKHHTGYAVDITTPGVVFTSFGTTDAYRWLADENFAVARAHGFLPSYPPGATTIGPDTERWEFVWVGVALAQGDPPGDQLFVRNGRNFSILEDDGSIYRTITYGAVGDDRFYLGDWDGDGTDTLAVRRGNVYHIRNSLTNGPADIVLGYGRADDVVLVGDWDGDGVDTFAVRRGNAYYIRNTLSTGVAESVIGYGTRNDQLLVGDWDGDGVDTFAVRRGNVNYLRNTLTTGVADIVLGYGTAGDDLVVGDWNGDFVDTFGVIRDGQALLRNSLTSGPASRVFAIPPGDEVLSGAL